MDFDSFRRILTAFADDSADVVLEKGKLLVQVREETLDATLHHGRNGELLVEENGERRSAKSWIVKRVARLPMLADRICCHVKPTPHFVTPSGKVLDSIKSNSDEPEKSDIGAATMEVFDRPPIPGTTSIWYLTADAGEGKTYLINHLAIQQARAYKEKKAEWLLVPIPLGGRTFLRFDDVVVATLVNDLRFQLLYYDAFLELVRLGVIAPAFDGFEEMIIEGSTGEAISALGRLVSDLKSAGAVLIAARKAYFDYASFRSQARLFDSIGKNDVTFGRLSLTRWGQKHFVDYARGRKIENPEQLFKQVGKRLGAEHPLLTRAVLVRRLVEVASETGNRLSGLLKRIEQRPQDYFREFVNEIVKREAYDKWKDKSGDHRTPLITVEQHHELLAMAADEMWMSSVDELKIDEIEFIADMFTENAGKNPSAARQIKERLKQHALLVETRNGRALAFDHEDFRLFYLGEALGRTLVDLDKGRLKALLDVASVPRAAVDQAASYVRRSGRSGPPVIDLLSKIATPETSISFIRENCGALAVALAALVDGETASPCEASRMSFPEDALRWRSLRNLTISDSYFSPTSLVGARFTNCRFARCRFERLELPDQLPDPVARTTFEACEFGSLVQVGGPDDVDEFYAPEQIETTLSRMGFDFKNNGEAGVKRRDEAGELSNDMKLVQRALRTFLRTTRVNENTMTLRLGKEAHRFKKDILPRLLSARILEPVQFQGKGKQRRFRLAVPMQRIDDALRSSALLSSGWQFDGFVGAFEK